MQAWGAVTLLQAWGAVTLLWVWGACDPAVGLGFRDPMGVWGAVTPCGSPLAPGCKEPPLGPPQLFAC